MSWLKISGMVLSGLLVLMGLAHFFLGGFLLSLELKSAGVTIGSEAWSDAAAGWTFGSVSMLVFGLIIASTVLSLGKGPTNVFPTAAIGIGLLLFGIGGCVWLHVGLHFVAFAVLGLIILMWARAAKNWSCRHAMDKP